MSWLIREPKLLVSVLCVVVCPSPARSLLMASRREVFGGTHLVCQKHEIAPVPGIVESRLQTQDLPSSTPLHDAMSSDGEYPKRSTLLLM